MKRRRHFNWLSILIVGFILLAGNRLQAQYTLGSIPYNPADKSEVEVISVYDKGIDHGFAPMLLRMKNGLEKEVSWKFDFTARSGYGQAAFRSSYEFTVQANSELERMVVIPVQNNFLSNQHGMSISWDVGVSSSAFQTRNLHWYASTMGMFSVGFSSGLPATNLDSETKYETSMLPVDWRGYTGLSFLVMTDQEWEQLDIPVKNAIGSWLNLGGRLDIYTTSNLQTLGALGLEGRDEVSLLLWDGTTVPARPAQLNEYSKTDWSVENSQDRPEFAGPSDGLRAHLGSKAFGAWLVLLVLLAFGIVVGPINLLILAPSGRRHRLFITTPLISIATSLLLVGSILLRDGIGGEGVRVLVMRIDPEAREVAITQEQFTRTGLIVGGDLQFDDPTYLSHSALDGDAWARVQKYDQNTLSCSFVPGERERYLGDWFFSRSEQGHFLQQVKPSRVRLEEAPGGDEKQILSSLGFTLNKLFYHDLEGNWWSYDGEFQTGQRVNLRSSNANAYAQWIAAQKDLSDATSRVAFPDSLEPGTFCAESNDPKAGFLETRTDINWKWQRAYIRGSVAKTTD